MTNSKIQIIMKTSLKKKSNPTSNFFFPASIAQKIQEDSTIYQSLLLLSKSNQNIKQKYIHSFHQNSKNISSPSTPKKRVKSLAAAIILPNQKQILKKPIHQKENSTKLQANIISEKIKNKSLSAKKHRSLSKENKNIYFISVKTKEESKQIKQTNHKRQNTENKRLLVPGESISLENIWDNFYLLKQSTKVLKNSKLKWKMSENGPFIDKRANEKKTTLEANIEPVTHELKEKVVLKVVASESSFESSRSFESMQSIKEEDSLKLNSSTISAVMEVKSSNHESIKHSNFRLDQELIERIANQQIFFASTRFAIKFCTFFTIQKILFRKMSQIDFQLDVFLQVYDGIFIKRIDYCPSNEKGKGSELKSKKNNKKMMQSKQKMKEKVFSLLLKKSSNEGSQIFYLNLIEYLEHQVTFEVSERGLTLIDFDLKLENKNYDRIAELLKLNKIFHFLIRLNSTFYLIRCVKNSNYDVKITILYEFRSFHKPNYESLIHASTTCLRKVNLTSMAQDLFCKVNATFEQNIALISTANSIDTKSKFEKENELGKMSDSSQLIEWEKNLNEFNINKNEIIQKERKSMFFYFKSMRVMTSFNQAKKTLTFQIDHLLRRQTIAYKIPDHSTDDSSPTANSTKSITFLQIKSIIQKIHLTKSYLYRKLRIQNNLHILRPVILLKQIWKIDPNSYAIATLYHIPLNNIVQFKIYLAKLQKSFIFTIDSPQRISDLNIKMITEIFHRLVVEKYFKLMTVVEAKQTRKAKEGKLNNFSDVVRSNGKKMLSNVRNKKRFENEEKERRLRKIATIKQSCLDGIISEDIISKLYYSKSGKNYFITIRFSPNSQYQARKECERDIILIQIHQEDSQSYLKMSESVQNLKGVWKEKDFNKLERSELQRLFELIYKAILQEIDSCRDKINILVNLLKQRIRPKSNEDGCDLIFKLINNCFVETKQVLFEGEVEPDQFSIDSCLFKNENFPDLLFSHDECHSEISNATLPKKNMTQQSTVRKCIPSYTFVEMKYLVEVQEVYSNSTTNAKIKLTEKKVILIDRDRSVRWRLADWEMKFATNIPFTSYNKRLFRRLAKNIKTHN